MMWLFLIPYILIGLVPFRRVAVISAYNGFWHTDACGPCRGERNRPVNYCGGLKPPAQFVGLILATISVAIWPVLLSGFVFAKSFAVLSNSDSFWELPKPIQGPVKTVKNSREAKRKSIAEEKKMHDAERRITINQAERDNDIPVTVWE